MRLSAHIPLAFSPPSWSALALPTTTGVKTRPSSSAWSPRSCTTPRMARPVSPVRRPRWVRLRPECPLQGWVSLLCCVVSYCRRGAPGHAGFLAACSPHAACPSSHNSRLAYQKQSPGREDTDVHGTRVVERGVVEHAAAPTAQAFRPHLF